MVALANEPYTPPEDREGLRIDEPHDLTLPDVLLIGDSISIGYMQPVTTALRGTANVARPKVNCGSTVRGVENIDEWLGETEWSVIHFNFGLHDLCYRRKLPDGSDVRDKVNGVQAVSPAEYRRNLETLVVRLKRTDAQLIFATTTVVPEGEDGRYVGDDLAYNEIARKVMTAHGIAINDLHAVTAAFPPALFKAPGDVHFMPEGSARLGQRVASVIAAALQP